MTRDILIEAVLDGMSQFKRAVHGHFYHGFEKLKLSQTQLELLKVIHQHQPISHKALAAQLQLTPGAVTQLLDGLDKLECIVRTQAADDRRVSYISLSRSGKRKLEELFKLRQKLFTNAFSVLSDEELQNHLEVQKKLIHWLDTHPSPTAAKER